MLPSGSWLHITFGLTLGVAITIFIAKLMSFLKNNATTQQFLRALGLFSLSIAALSFLYGSALSGGLSDQWQLLGFPGQEHTVRILDIGYVQTQSGNIYHFAGSDHQEGRWEQVDKVISNEHIVSSSDNCGTFSFLPALKDNFIDYKSACVSDELWSTTKVVYAVDDLGRVYLWSHEVWRWIQELGERA